MGKYFDFFSYLIGFFRGFAKGSQDITLTGSITATDDGNGNITITEV